MIVCGLTGGVGMGKSTAAGFLGRHGVPIVDTDELARELVQPGQPALGEIQSAFGSRVIGPGRELNREELARIIFADIQARRAVEAILHPRIQERWLTRIDTWRAEDRPIAVVVIPLLFETRAEAHFDRILCVACSVAAQRERLKARGWTPEQIDQRNAAQLPVEQKIDRADFVIWTEGGLENQSAQIKRVLASLDWQDGQPFPRDN